MDPSTPFRSLSGRLADPASPLSRTPSSRQQCTDHEINQLLTNLSPTSTLEALAAPDAVLPGKRHRQIFIQHSVASASTSERAWGIKAAFAGKKLREWHKELLTWSWSGYDSVGSKEEEYWGGLPARIVQEYEERLEAMRDDMETLEVEDLKSYVRSTHLGPQARGASIPGTPVDYDHLEDFTAVITATIVQALPILSRLSSLMSLWMTRMRVLRHVPAFLRGSRDCQESMLSAWNAIVEPDIPRAKRKPNLSRESFGNIQATLQDQIFQLGRRMDTMLDLSEGSKDTLPEHWIDIMDGLENNYSTWAVKAEEVVLHNELNVEGDEDRDVHNRENWRPNGGLPLDTLQLTHMFDRDVESEGISRNAGNDFDRVESTPPTTPQFPQCKGDILLGDRLEDGPFNPDNLGVHDQPQEAWQDPWDGNAVDDTKCRPDPSKPARRPPPLMLDNRNSLADSIPSSEMGSDISCPESATSDYFSNLSSPEIRSASIIEYVGSPALVTNPWSSKESTVPLEVASGRTSLQTERAGPGNLELGASAGIISPYGQRSRASTFIPEPTTHEGLGLPDSEPLAPTFTKHHVRTRSASMQSVEVIPKHEIRKIMVRRSESYSSAPSGLRGLGPETGKAPDVPAIAKLEHRELESPEEIISAPIPETHQHGTQKLPVAPYDQEPKAPELQGLAKEESLVPPKIPHRFQQVSDLGPGSTLVKIRRKAVAATPEKVLPGNSDDRLEARISSILTEIPTHIRLTSEPEPDAPEVNNSSPRPKTPTSRSPALRLNRAQTAITPPTMTLAPAQPTSFKSRSQSGEPEIKLYHLHQSGKEVPIKLFVRLVGEAGERVMVRIGGGWADLAEYLKEYASHHGRRSASDTRFDIQDLPSSPVSQGSSSSRPGSPVPSKPSPAAFFKRQHTTPGKFETPHTPVSDPLRPSSRVSWTDEDSPSLGLAGPKLKKVEISPRKQAWVDEMLEQARGGGGGAAIGEIGKVGGTKRVFFKGRSRAPSNV